MRNPEGESDHGPLRPLFDRRLKLEFHGSRVTSDAGLLAYRELDDAPGLTALAGGVLADSRTGRNGWHGIISLLRQSVYGRLAGYEDVNGAARLGRDPAMRWIVGGKAVERGGASTSQMGWFETEPPGEQREPRSPCGPVGPWNSGHRPACERSSSRSERRSCATGARSRSRWPRLSFLVTCSQTSCAVSTGSDRRQPRHERRHPVPSRRRLQDRCARTAGKKCHSAPPTPPIGPQSSGSARRWPSFEGELHVEPFRITLNGLGGFHMGNPG